MTIGRWDMTSISEIRIHAPSFWSVLVLALWVPSALHGCRYRSERTSVVSFVSDFFFKLRSGLTMPLSRYSVGSYQETSSYATHQGNTRPQSSQFAEPLWTEPDLRSGISVHLKKKKKAQAGNELSNNLPKSSQARKKPAQP